MITFSTDALSGVLAILPEILLTIWAVLVLSMDALGGPQQKRVLGYVAGFGMFGIALLTLIFAVPSGENELSEQLVLGGMVRHDNFAHIFRAMVLLGGGLTALLAMGDDRLRERGDFYGVLIVAVLGASLAAAAADLITVFLALETLSITLYLLAGFLRDDERSVEAGLKYFLFGAFASAISLYGISLLFGLSGSSEAAAYVGSTNIYHLGEALSQSSVNLPPLLVALSLVMVGFGFKISAVPFHFWTADVYEGAPTPITSFLSTASKAASFALLVRFLVAVFPPEGLGAGDVFSDYWVQLVAVLAAVSMTLGNMMALVQSNLKRLLAYSTIAHAGYTLIGVAAIATTNWGDGAAAVAYYLFVYVVTNTLAFAVVILFANATGSYQIKDLGSFSRRNPWLALAMTVALLSLAGIPPAAGFVGKFLLFRAAVDAGLTWLALLGVVNVIIGLYYYLMVVKVMYVDPLPEGQSDQPVPVAAPYRWAVGISTLMVLLFGTLLVSPLVNWATDAAQSLAWRF